MSSFNVFPIVLFVTCIPVFCFGNDHAIKTVNHIRVLNAEFENKLGRKFFGSWETTDEKAKWCIETQFKILPIRTVCIGVIANVKELQFELNTYINDRKLITFTIKETPENCFPIPLPLPLSGLGICIEIAELKIDETQWHLCINVHLTYKLDLSIIYLPCLDVPRLFGTKAISSNSGYLDTKSILVKE